MGASMTWPNPNTHPEFYDPFASAERHPQLYAGYNADDVNGDMIDGPGTNWEIWPVIFDTYEGYTPIIMTDEMQEVFDGCADWVIPAVYDTVCPPSSIWALDLSGTWPDITPPWMSNTIVFPYEAREQSIAKGSATVTVDGPGDTVTFGGNHEQEIRRTS